MVTVLQNLQVLDLTSNQLLYLPPMSNMSNLIDLKASRYCDYFDGCNTHLFNADFQE